MARCHVSPLIATTFFSSLISKRVSRYEIWIYSHKSFHSLHHITSHHKDPKLTRSQLMNKFTNNLFELAALLGNEETPQLSDEETEDMMVLDDDILAKGLANVVNSLASYCKIVVISGPGISINAGCKIVSLSSSHHTLTVFSSCSWTCRREDWLRISTPFIEGKKGKVL